MIGDPQRRLLEQLDHGRLCPLEIVNDNDQRIRRSNRLEILTNRPAQLEIHLGTRGGHGFHHRLEAEEDGQPVLDGAPLGLGRKHARDPAFQFAERCQAIVLC